MKKSQIKLTLNYFDLLIKILLFLFLSSLSLANENKIGSVSENNATLPYLVKLANKGYQKALGEDKNFLAGLNVHKGMVTYKAVADVFGYNFITPELAISN